MAEGAGLLNRFTVKSRNGGSNPPLSASFYWVFNTSLILSPDFHTDFHTGFLELPGRLSAESPEKNPKERDWNPMENSPASILEASLASATLPKTVGDQPEPVSPMEASGGNISTEVKISGMTQVFRSNPQPTEKRPES